jgi:hypothetical protein
VLGQHIDDCGPDLLFELDFQYHGSIL